MARASTPTATACRTRSTTAHTIRIRTSTTRTGARLPRTRAELSVIRSSAMRAVAIAALLLGCGGGHAAPDAPLDTAPDGASLDSDGDGVPDAIDNCPHDQNPNQHDEDRGQTATHARRA